MSIVLGTIGFGCTLPVFGFLAGIVCIALFFIVQRKEDEESAEIATSKEDAEERFKDEIADAVEKRMKGTIKVRCRYCGSLNDEGDVRCDSCGATL